MSNSDKQCILVVDDEESNLMVLSFVLEPEYEVITAKNGRGALNAVKLFLPDLILLDIVMPDMDGYEVLSELKNNDDHKDIPVIFVTGLRDLNEKEKGLRLGAVDYIIKPFSSLEIEAKVKDHIKRKTENE